MSWLAGGGVTVHRGLVSAADNTVSLLAWRPLSACLFGVLVSYDRQQPCVQMKCYSDSPSPNIIQCARTFITFYEEPIFPAGAARYIQGI